MRYLIGFLFAITAFGQNLAVEKFDLSMPMMVKLHLGSSELFIQARIPGPGGTPAVAGYVGPGDVKTSAKVYWGLRAYNAAYATALGASFDWSCTNGSFFTGTVHVTTTGGLNATELASIASTCAANDVNFQKLYDQSGANACSGSVPCDIALSNVTTEKFLVNCIGSLPCITNTTTSNTGFGPTTSAGTIAQPFTISAVYGRTAGTTSYGVAVDSGNDLAFLGSNNATNKGRASGSVEITPTMSDNAVHAVQALFNGTGTNSIVNIDGTETTGSLGTSSISGGFCVMRQGNGTTGCGNNPLQGKLLEVGLWASGFSSGDRTAMCHNQYTYYNTAASC